ncbi:MAG: type II secretion system GspH family protein [Ruminiclostridium sp.]|nr:type II secretion system GspH family protein [Ruminiclostridium sp.]
MKKINFYNKKGFTLVECIVAIAVFAVMTSMVMIIISSAIQTTRQSVTGQSDLNQMVEAVENDQSIKMYDSSTSHNLKMKFGGDTENFSITYDTTDGYMSYMTCKYCDYYGPRYEFIKRIADSSTYQNADPAMKAKYPFTYWFDPILPGETNEETTYSVPWPDNPDGSGVQKMDHADTNESSRLDFGTTSQNKYMTYLRQFCCPKCEHLLEPADIFPLHCLICDYEAIPQKVADYVDTANPSASTGFHWDNATSSFRCNKCGSYRVIEKGMNDKVGAGATFEVGGMYSNAIRYGNVKTPDDDEVKTLITGKKKTDNSDVNNFKFDMTVTSFSSYIPHKYKVTLSNLNSATGNKDADFKIKLPPGYKVNNLKITNISSPSASEYAVGWTSEDGLEDCSKGSTITAFVMGGKSQLSFAFELVNVKNKNSFDADYAGEGGLAKYWFRLKVGSGGTIPTLTLPRDLDPTTGNVYFPPSS